MRIGQRLKGALAAGTICSLAFLGAISATPNSAGAYTLSNPGQTIHILCSETDAGCLDFGGPAPGSGIDSNAGETADGTIFTASPNPTEPSTGTGVFNPFLRVQDAGAKADVDYAAGSTDPLNPAGTFSSESGFNTDMNIGNQMNYQAKPGDGTAAHGWTRSVMFGELDTSDGYVTLKLDANEHGKASSANNLIVITEMQIFVGQGLDNPELDGNALGAASDCDTNGEPNPNCYGYSGNIFDNDDPNNNKLLNQEADWSLDGGINGNVDVVLQASICDTAGNCGSGKGDMEVKIPVGFFLSALPSDNFVLYFEAIKNHDGFEEWSFASAGDSRQASEPATLGLFGIALAGMGYIRRRRRGANA